jgi:hypothetical protein
MLWRGRAESATRLLSSKLRLRPRLLVAYLPLATPLGLSTTSLPTASGLPLPLTTTAALTPQEAAPPPAGAWNTPGTLVSPQ